MVRRCVQPVGREEGEWAEVRDKGCYMWRDVRLTGGGGNVGGTQVERGHVGQKK